MADPQQTLQAPAHDDVRERRYQAAAHVVFRSVGDDVVMLDLERGTYFSLNDTGGQVWLRLCAGETPQHAAEAIAATYEADPAVVGQDVETTVRQLLDAGLLQPASS